MLKRKQLIDTETGEICYEENAVYMNKLWSDKKEGGIILPRNHHKKLYTSYRLSDVIANRSDLLKTFLLTEYIVGNTNRIGQRKGKGFARENDIAEILGMSEKKAREYLSRMQKLRVIAKLTAETGDRAFISYVFNPVYVNSCKYVPLDLYVVFQKELDAVIPDWIKLKYAEAWHGKQNSNTLPSAAEA